jgi:hypothetical protein
LPLSIHTAQIPNLITWFNGFLGFREIQKRIERVEMKLRDIGIVVPALNRRYYFHSTYKSLAARNRTYGRIDVNEPNNNRVISLIAAVREFATPLTGQQRDRLRARIVESLDPDRDIREFEHEMRAFVHYKGRGYGVLSSDNEADGRFDFLVQGAGREFELECKTFAEDIGNPISINDSVHVFRAFKSAIRADHSFRESGILTLTFPARITLSEQEMTKMVTRFLSDNPAQRRRGDYALTFEKRPDWDVLLRTEDRQSVLDDISIRYAGHNLHSMTMLSRHHAVMGVVRSERKSRPANSIFDRLKSASEQFSRTRPAVVWGHFLGFEEDDFRELLEERRLGRRAFDVFGNYLFKNTDRNYISRLRLSADGTPKRADRSKGMLVQNMTSGGGPAYDLTSRVSRFDPTSTE